MIKISTPELNLLISGSTVKSASDSLNEEDQNFYTSIIKDLDLMVKYPGKKTISNILKYSKSL